MLIGNTSGTVGYITLADRTNNILKVKLANSIQEYGATEAVHSNIIVVTGTTSGELNNNRSLPFTANVMTGNVTTARSTITSITPSTFIAEKNAFTQNPIVRLYSIYYPGEWYPPNEAGNPSGPGEGRSWPNGFPIRVAEVVGDTADDLLYNVTYGGVSYQPFPINISGIEQTSEGKINELSLTVFNFDNIISRLVEDPNLVGNNTSNSVMARVNGEWAYDIDPRTINKTPTQIGSAGSTERALLQAARDAGLAYSEDIVGYYGKQNAAFDYTQTEAVGGTWLRQRSDSRDLLGGVVEIKTTFANFLDHWPEHSNIISATSNSVNAIVTVTNAAPYRIGDIVRSVTPTTKTSVGTITKIVDNKDIYLDRPLLDYLPIGTGDLTMRGMYIRPSGNRLFITGASTDSVITYTLNPAWELSTATFLEKKSIGTEDGDPGSLVFNSTGTRMLVAGGATDNLYSYQLSSAWNVTTATLSASANILALTGESNSYGLAIDSTGSNVYTVGFTNDTVYQLRLSTPWDITTASLFTSKSISAQETSPWSLSFSSDGTSMYIVGTAGDDITQYTLTEAWNVATATSTRTAYFATFEPSPIAHTWRPNGTKLYIGSSVTDNVYALNLTQAWNVATITSSVSFANAGRKLYITNAEADTESYVEDKFRIDQLESLSEHVATFGLVSWLQYFKMSVPRRKYYKNTCQWVYKGPECQYPGPGGLPIPGTNNPVLTSTKPYNLQNQDTTIKTQSLITWDTWAAGATSAVGYTNYGDGNSLINDRTPYSEYDVVWNIANQDAAADQDGGFYTPTITIDNTKMYRFSVWTKRKTIGNGATYFRALGGGSPTGNLGLLERNNVSSVDTSADFVVTTWSTLEEDPWYLFVGHVWPVNSGNGSIHIDTGIYKQSSKSISKIKASKITTGFRDFVWQDINGATRMDCLLYGATDTTTRQQYYQPRIDICDGNEPSIDDLLEYSGQQLLYRGGEDVCSKSLAACTLRNNQIHFGGFPGVGRTIPRA